MDKNAVLKVINPALALLMLNQPFSALYQPCIVAKSPKVMGNPSQCGTYTRYDIFSWY